jgi:hypothetical protein
VLNADLSIVSFVKSSDVSLTLFSILCRELGSIRETLLYDTEVRWLSRGKVLERVTELSDELCLFLHDTRLDLSAHFSDQKWMFFTLYLADIFEKVNELNLSLQGKGTNILILNSKLQAFQQKLSSWPKAFERGCLHALTISDVSLRLFSILCRNLGSIHETLLYDTEVRWLSRGNVLKRVTELSDELRLFLHDTRLDLSAHFCD